MRATMLGLWGMAALSCVLGLLAPPPAAHLQDALGEQLLDLVRVTCAAALVIVLLLGPGIVWRGHHGRKRVPLGFLFLPGLGLLAATGGLAWALAGAVAPSTASLVVVTPVLALVLFGLLRAAPGELLDPAECQALLVTGCIFGLTIARALWSLGPVGELYSGSVSRTLEVGDRSDSRVPFVIVQLVAHGTGPYSPLGASYFAPYDFSSRGPLAGISSAPVVLSAGGSPPVTLPDQRWSPFDKQGFMAYRIAMMALASTAFLSLWTLVRRIGGTQAARFALLLAATTPFLVHETWFTWPKLLAASFVLLSGFCVITRRPLLAGLLLGLGYLSHPIALLSLPALGGLALWPLVEAQLRRPQVKRALLLALGAALFVLVWRLVNGSHYTQNGFADYLKFAGPNMHPSPWHWLSYRLESLGNTLIPLQLFVFSADNFSINVVGGVSPGVIHFAFQYWTTLPFGLAIVFFPLLLASLWRALRIWPWPVFAAVIAPFLAFSIYWGASVTGMMREGLQAWAMTLVAVIALEQSHNGFHWLSTRSVRVILMLRAVEVLVMAMMSTLATRHQLIDTDFALTDSLALIAMVAFAGRLALWIWRETPHSTNTLRGRWKAELEHRG